VLTIIDHEAQNDIALVQLRNGSVGAARCLVFATKPLDEQRQHAGNEEAAHPFAGTRYIGPPEDEDRESADVIAFVEGDSGRQCVLPRGLRQLVARILDILENHDSQIRQFAKVAPAVKKLAVHAGEHKVPAERQA